MTADPVRRRLGPLGARLALAFVGVALAAVAALAGLTAWGASRQVDDLARRQRQEDTVAVAAAAAQAYDQAGGWDGADLAAASVLATSANADLRVRDVSGLPVEPAAGLGPMMDDFTGRMGHGSTGMMPTETTDLRTGPTTSAPVLSEGGRVGSVELRFASGLSDAQQQINDAFRRVVAGGAALAALIALAVSVFVSRRITRPITALSATVEAIERGGRDARVRMADAPGELGQLAGAFDRMADTLARQDELRRAMVADVAHELRTPVTILQASCEALVDGVREPTPAQLASLHDETLRLGRIIADLETLAAADAAGLHLERRRVDLAALVGDAAASLGARAADAVITVVTHLDPIEVDGDPGRLHQIAVNLIGNAVKYTPAGGTVTITVDRNDPFARLQVVDTGPGIPVDELPRVFDRFWRGSTGASASGSGIGLAVAAELVRAHHGQISAASEPGSGARFTVQLPLP